VDLALNIVGRPIDSDEPIMRDALLSLKKLQGEGKQEEIKVVLGWELK
jgi:hypothetical protein